MYNKNNYFRIINLGQNFFFSKVTQVEIEVTVEEVALVFNLGVPQLVFVIRQPKNLHKITPGTRIAAEIQVNLQDKWKITTEKPQ